MTWRKKKVAVEEKPVLHKKVAEKPTLKRVEKVEKPEHVLDLYSHQRGRVEGLAIACAHLTEHDAARRIVKAILKENEQALEEIGG